MVGGGYGSLVCGVWMAYLIFVHRSGQMVSFRWNFSTAKLAVWVEYGMINSTLHTTVPPVETREWDVVFDCLRLLYVRNRYLICGIGRASVSYVTKLARISWKYHFGGIFPVTRQYLPKIPPHIPPVTYLRTRSYVLNKPQTQWEGSMYAITFSHHQVFFASMEAMLRYEGKMKPTQFDDRRHIWHGIR